MNFPNMLPHRWISVCFLLSFFPGQSSFAAGEQLHEMVKVLLELLPLFFVENDEKNEIELIGLIGVAGWWDIKPSHHMTVIGAFH